MAFFLPSTLELLPKYYAASEEYLPTCAHPGEDAGADLKAYIPKEVDEAALSALLQTTYSAWRKSDCELSHSLVINGKYPERGSTHAWSANNSHLIAAAVDALPNKRLVVIHPGQTVKISAGFKIALPDLSEHGPYVPVYKIMSRSGLAINHGIKVVNVPGIIDAGYRNWVVISLWNTSDKVHIFTDGAKIAQGLYEVVVDQSRFDKKDTLVSEEEFNKLSSSRGQGGLGHTGI
jgi:dUTP pyrophosphatase